MKIAWVMCKIIIITMYFDKKFLEIVVTNLKKEDTTTKQHLLNSWVFVLLFHIMLYN